MDREEIRKGFFLSLLLSLLSTLVAVYFTAETQKLDDIDAVQKQKDAKKLREELNAIHLELAQLKKTCKK